MSIRRLLAAASLALVAAALAGPAGPVSALSQPGLRVVENQTVEQAYGPIPGQNPAPATPPPTPDLVTPDTCRQVTYCDVVPLEVVVPATLKEEDEFFVHVELTWKTSQIPATALTGDIAVNDMDLYVWEDPQGEEFLEESASNDVPEQLKMYRPVKGKYQIVVLNYSGPNTGYQLKVSYKPERIVPPFESLEPEFQMPLDPVDTAPLTPPVDLSEFEAAPPPDFSGAPVEPPPPAPVAAPEPVVAVPLEPVPVEPDPDFAGFDDAEFEESLAAPAETDVLRQRQARAVGPPTPASGASLLFWLAAVPLALVAAAGVWLARRGSAVLRFK
jgi:hypothetical protein